MVQFMKNKNKTAEPGVFWRIVLSSLGAALIIVAILRLALFFFGESTYANVSVRRVGGASDGRPAGFRYEWSIDYSFADKKGNIYNGTTMRLGSDVSVDSDDRVYYFLSAPFINALEGDAEPNLAQPVYIIIGVFLIYIINRKSPCAQKSPKN